MHVVRLTFAAALLLAATAGLRAGEAASIDEKAVRSLKTMFGDSSAVTRSRIVLTREEQDRIWTASHTRWQHDTVTVYRCAVGSRLTGYGFLDDVKGKLQFITMLVGIAPDGKIRDVDILVYREAYGGEVTNDSFRKQFRGASPEDDIHPGDVIRNISGATISARAVTFGVRRIAATFRLLQQGALSR